MTKLGYIWGRKLIRGDRKPLTKKQKQEIAAVVKKAVEQYKDVFKRLARE